MHVYVYMYTHTLYVHVYVYGCLFVSACVECVSCILYCTVYNGKRLVFKCKCISVNEWI